jgi:hypothetical protein
MPGFGPLRSRERRSDPVPCLASAGTVVAEFRHSGARGPERRPAVILRPPGPGRGARRSTAQRLASPARVAAPCADAGPPRGRAPIAVLDSAGRRSRVALPADVRQLLDPQYSQNLPFDIP